MSSVFLSGVPSKNPGPCDKFFFKLTNMGPKDCLCENRIFMNNWTVRVFTHKRREILTWAQYFVCGGISWKRTGAQSLEPNSSPGPGEKLSSQLHIEIKNLFLFTVLHINIIIITN